MESAICKGLCCLVAESSLNERYHSSTVSESTLSAWGAIRDLMRGYLMFGKGKRGKPAMPMGHQIKLRPENHVLRATAIVYLDRDAGRATKVFLSGADTEWSRRRFYSELAAYAIVQLHSELVALTPTFYGQCHIASVLDKDDADLSSQFLLDCAYEMELLQGQFTKIGAIHDAPNREHVVTIFRNACVFGKETDVLRDAAGNITKVIDIGQRPFEYRSHND